MIYFLDVLNFFYYFYSSLCWFLSLYEKLSHIWLLKIRRDHHSVDPGGQECGRGLAGSFTLSKEAAVKLSARAGVSYEARGALHVHMVVGKMHFLTAVELTVASLRPAGAALKERAQPALEGLHWIKASTLGLTQNQPIWNFTYYIGKMPSPLPCSII